MTRADDSLSVTCLCAEWCGACREYRAVFDALAVGLPQHRFSWMDVEDEADTVGDLDIETFPTLLVRSGPRLLFAGAVPPRLADAQRLLERLRDAVQAGSADLTSRLPDEFRRACEVLARHLDAQPRTTAD